MNPLRLIAFDSEDLRIVSAHVQDAVMRVADLVPDPRSRTFTLEMNRFVWEKRRGLFDRRGERRRSVLAIKRVTGVRSSGIDRSKGEDILNLLSVTFHRGEDPAGAIELTFSGGAAVRLEVECIEVQLTDIGAAWETLSRPDHDNSRNEQ
ncbi:hypothetical protein CSC94_19040 [Zhengella mangrovi]|uniref:DUF2948 domain-containing protein n=1 Tax=Zhengella mangrovi TaxID=1982044 RepID=A0A2G1QJ28_9HYPH|nr:DUF2948 family protein [Zhengella mangrovi]PHP65454.1 hypothetical protein CSC94_19040 [Zhengella mangrovi]